MRVMSFVHNFLLYQPILWIMRRWLFLPFLFPYSFFNILHLFQLKFGLYPVALIELYLISDRFHSRIFHWIRRDETFNIYIVVHLGVGKGRFSIIHSVWIPNSIFTWVSWVPHLVPVFWAFLTRKFCNVGLMCWLINICNFFRCALILLILRLFFSAEWFIFRDANVDRTFLGFRDDTRDVLFFRLDVVLQQVICINLLLLTNINRMCMGILMAVRQIQKASLRISALHWR